MATTEEARCMTPECGKEARWKGLCQSCYGQAKHLISSNQTTWEELGDMGLAKDTKKPFLNAFRAIKAKQPAK